MLSPKQKKCIELMALGELNQKEIAKEIKVSEQSICNWKKDDEFIEAYDAEVKALMRSVAPRAFRTHIKLLDAHSEMVRYMAAKDILDRTGYKPDENVKVEGIAQVQIIDDIPSGGANE